MLTFSCGPLYTHIRICMWSFIIIFVQQHVAFNQLSIIHTICLKWHMAFIIYLLGSMTHFLFVYGEL